MGEIDRDFSNKPEDHKKTVEIFLKIIGPSPPCRLNVPSSVKVHELRKMIAGNRHMPIENLRLVLRGHVLHDNENGDDVAIQLNNGGQISHKGSRWGNEFADTRLAPHCPNLPCRLHTVPAIDHSLIVAVKPKPPPKHFRDEFEDDDDDELRFQLPPSTSRWKRKIFYILRDKLKLPDMLLMVIFSISPKVWVIILTWFILASIARRYEVAPLFLLATGFGLIFYNLGHRQQGELSAYSVFNEDFRELPGTLNADHIDRDIRAGRF